MTANYEEEYDECPCDDHDEYCRLEDQLDRADNLRDEAIDDFLFIETEQDAIDAIKRYPSLTRYLPLKWEYVYQIINLDRIKIALNEDALVYRELVENVKSYIRNGE